MVKQRIVQKISVLQKKGQLTYIKAFLLSEEDFKRLYYELESPKLYDDWITNKKFFMFQGIRIYAFRVIKGGFIFPFFDKEKIS